MSATMEAKAISALLDDAPIIESEGRTYPVETHYLDTENVGRIENAVVASIQQALHAHEGSLLVFLPGAAEIHRVANGLAALRLGKEVEIAPLYANLSIEAQDQALSAVRSPGHRKVVLATSIAETSLTVEGITVVIDSGLMRVPRFSPRTGMTRLTTVPVSVASADQRRGRAGRLGPGVCYRLWTETEQRQLPPSSTPEIREADLAPLALELAAWGAPDPAALVWLDPPPAAAYQQARELLVQLGALHENGGLTPHGKRVAALGLHPRLAHMVLQAIPLELGALACELAVMLSERDFMRAAEEGCGCAQPHRSALARCARRERARTLTLAYAAASRRKPKCSCSRSASGRARVMQRRADCCSHSLIPTASRSGGRRGGSLLATGAAPCCRSCSRSRTSAIIVAAELDDSGAESRIYLAAPLQEEELFDRF